MGKLLRFLLWALGAAFVLLLVFAIALPRMVDPNDFKDRVEQLVHDRTGRVLQIGGDLSVSLFPWLRLRTGALTLSNAQGFGDVPMARVDSADVGLKLLPILRGRFEIDTIRLSGLMLNLETSAGGVNNWSDLLPAADDDAGPLSLAAVIAHGVVIRDSRLVYANRAENSHYILQSINLDAGRIVAGEPAAVSLRFELLEPDRPQPLPVEVKTRLTLDSSGARLVLADTVVRSKPAGLDSRMVVPAIEYQIDSGVLDLRSVELRMGGLPVYVTGKVPTMRLEVASQQLSVPRVEIVTEGAELSGSINGTRMLDAPSLYGRLQTPVLDLRKALPSLGIRPETSDAGALSRFSLHAVYQAASDQFRLQDIRALLDDSSLTGSISVPSISQKRFGFDLELDQINFDRYLSPEGRRRSGAGSEAEGVPGAMLFALPVALLRDMSGSGGLRARSLQFGGLVSEDIVVGVEAGNGLVRLSPVQARLYGGRLDGSLALDASQDPPRLVVEETINDVQVESLLVAAGISERLSGTGNLAVSLSGSGNDGREVLRSLTGETRFSFRDGAIKRFDLRRILIEARRLYQELKGREVEVAAEESDEFRFTEMTGRLMFNNGVVSNDDLAIKSPLFRVSGRGTADLVAQTMNYLLDVSVVATAEGQGGKELEDLKGVTIPVRIRGPLTAPVYSVDMGVLLERELKKAITKKLEGDRPATPPADGQAQPAAPPKDDKQQLQDLLLRELEKRL